MKHNPSSTGIAQFRPSRLYHGWLVVAAAFLSSGFVIGTAQWAFGVFVQPLEQDFGWTRTQINASLAFSAISGLIAPIVGRSMDRFGARPVMLASLAVMTVSYLLRPFMTELWHWYLLSALQFAGFPGGVTLPAGKLVGLWFQRTRGRMMGITAMGNNFGGLTMPLVAGFVVGVAGWEWSYAAFGFIGIVVMTYIFFVVRDDPEYIARATARAGRLEVNPPEDTPRSGQRTYRVSSLTVGQALRTRAFYAITLGFVTGAFTYSTVTTQIVPHLENEGLSIGLATIILSLTAAFGMAGKIGFGYLVERIPLRYAVMLSLVVQAMALTILITIPSSPFIWLFVPVYGLSFGGLGTLSPLSIQEAFGVKSFGSILGLVQMAQLVSFLVGPLMAGAIFDATGSYRLVFVIVALLFMLGVLAMTQARPPAEAPLVGREETYPSSERER